MVVAFIWSNGVIVEDRQGDHYSRSYTDEYCSRFFSVADKAVFFTRMQKSDITDGLTKMDHMPIEYHECINPMSITGVFRRRDNYNNMETILSKCDCAVINLPSLFIGRKAEKICEKLRIPYLVQLGGCPWDVLKNRGLLGKICAIPAFIANRNDIKRAPAVIYVTKDFLQKRYPTYGKQIGCSNVTLQELSYDILEKRLDKIDRHDGKIVLGTAAAIDVKYKGQQYIIKTLSRLSKRGIDNFEYQIVGGGKSDYLQALVDKMNISDKVKILGSLKHEEVFKWLDEIDLYIQPSRTEGLPRAMIEAMSRGVPCVGANSGGIPELISSKYIFSNGNNELNEIERIITSLDKKELRKMAIENFTTAKQYDVNVLRERRNTFYREILLKCNEVNTDESL